jgi:Tol biopolymer transport system component/DNA-binding winged helix-turn-helix (wHTH) protein
MSLKTKHIYEFGHFRLDAAEHLLLRDGKTVPLTPKAFELLIAMVERPGRLLEKDELLKSVWPETYVEEANLATNISVLRKALGDGENGQRYIETVPRRGYRFVANVKKVEDERVESMIREQSGSESVVAEEEQAANAGEPIPAHPSMKVENLASNVKRYQRSALIALAVLILLGAALAYFVLRPPLQPKVLGYTPITNDGHPKTFPQYNARARHPLVVGDKQIYFTEVVGRQRLLTQVSIAGGETVVIPTEFAAPLVLDLSPNRTELLVASQASDLGGEWPLWVVPVNGGPSRRVGGILCHGAAWAPDGKKIVYAYGSELYLVESDGTAARKLVTVANRPYSPRWSPDGSRLRFAIQDPKTFSTSLWEVSADGGNLHPFLPGWNAPASLCCGNWTADGKYFVFQSSIDWRTNIWAIRELAGSQSKSEPTLLTNGPMDFWYPAPSPDSRRIYVVGVKRRGELARYDAKTQRFESYLPNVSAEHLDFSRDGEWMAYVTFPEGDLWRSKVDGSERHRLSFPPIRATVPRWAPDGKRIAFSAVIPGKPRKIYIVSAEGGAPQQLTAEERMEQDPGWSPDGKMLVFGITDTRTIHLIDLNTLEVTKLPGSEGMFSPRWSPDGHYIATLSTDAQRTMLFDRALEKWSVLATTRVGWPHWSRDAKRIYFMDPGALFRLRIDNREIEQLTTLKDLRLAFGYYGPWVGWAPDDSPLVLRDTGIQDIYALEWQIP